ncbi:cysteine peptidase family C39 domain-containing protein [Cellulosilyticum ruminicola]|uniref:hypothetical protein n=1 Tax=Cellulosilyticum ruminicola TaxID=425254 RepID=UPI0006D00BBB|nr:hypothetical protein [Cellulosilyticum ruminicola]
MNIYEMQQEYDSLLHYHCLKNCLIQGLTYYGVLNPHLYIDVSCKLSLKENKLSGYISNHSVGSNKLWEIFKEFLTIEAFEEDITAEQYVSNYLKEDKVIIVATDTYYLPYQNSFNKYHGSHAIILTREYEDAFQIIDWYEPHYFKGLISKDILIQARNSKNPFNENPFSGGEIGREVYILERFKQEEYNAQQIFAYGVKKIYEEFYKGNKSLISSKKLYGIEALKKIIEYIPKMLTQEGKIISNAKKIHNDLFLIFIARKLQAYYFMKSENVYSSETLVQINEIYKTLRDEYERLLIMIIRMSIKVEDVLLNKISIVLQAISQLEESLGQHLEKLYMELERD